MRRKTDNRGSALIVVIIVVAFVSLLVTTLFMMTVINIQMKSVDREAKENFYSAEGALEQISLGLQQELSETSAAAYAMIMQEYAGNTLEVVRRQKFNDKLFAQLKTTLENGGAVGTYDIGYLEDYLSDEVAAHTVLNSTASCQLVSESGSVVLKGLEVSYTDANGLLSVIETDIRLTAPNLNMVQPSDMPDVFDYSIIANKKLVGEFSGTVEFTAGVYAGDGVYAGEAVNADTYGMELSNGAVWNFKQASRVVVEGAVSVADEAELSTTSDMDLWAKELYVSGGTLTSRGRTFVANDLLMSKEGSTVTLAGEYYGYGNGEMLTEAGVMLSAGGDSSAILINGVDTTLDMSNIRRLLLSGSAQIATGSLAFDESQFDNIRPENEPSLDTKKQPATLGSASYYMQSVGNGKLVSSADDYMRAQTDNTYVVVEGSWERLVLVNNSDGTISLLDPNNEKHKNKYITVKTEDQNRLVAESDSVGVNEKFYLYVITEGGTNYYALKSYANGKFVSIDTYYPAEGNSVEAVLCANRDKITDDAQLFLMNIWGAAPGEEEEEEEASSIGTLVFNYIDANNLNVKFGFRDWGHPVPAGTASWITYKVIRDGVELAAPRATEQHMDFVFVYGNIWCLQWNIPGLQENDVIEYTIRYTDNSQDSNLAYLSGTYTHKDGQGNAATEGKVLQDGVYLWRWDFVDTDDMYVQPDDAAKRLVAWQTTYDLDDASWFLFHIVNNHDGTVSLRSLRNQNYLTVQADGMVNDTGSKIDANSKFTIKHVLGTQGWYYQIWTHKDSEIGEQIICFDRDHDYKYMYTSDTPQGTESRFQFEWQRPTSYEGTKPEPVIPPEPANNNPVTSVVYANEDKATASFTSPFWSANGVGTVTLRYNIGLSPEYPQIPMTVSGTTGTCTIPNLQHMDKVIYWFEYTYKDAGGVSHTATTSKYIYIHERKYGDLIHVNSQNEDINLGESIEVKSNQIAYLVPPECIGVNEGNVMIGKNPMSSEDFTQLMTFANDTAKYPDFEIVSFTRNVEGLGKSLDAYRAPGTEGYRTVFVQSEEGTMVYFYVDFDSNNTSAYFRDYYAKNQSTLESYMRNYVNEIRLSNSFTRLTTHGNMVFSPNGSSGKIDLRSNEGYGANLDAVALSGLRNEEAGYLRRFKALSAKLMLDYDELTATEKTRDLFDNIVRFSEDAGDVEGQAFAGISPSVNAIPYTVDNSRALVVHNKGLGAFHYRAADDPEKKVCLIIATGDVVVENDFSGVIIARGTVTIQNTSVNKITGNQEGLYKVLKYQMDPGNPASKTFLEHYFRDGELYVLDDGSGAVVTDGDYISYGELITYEEWTKR